MGFKLFILSLAVLAVAVSASSICKRGTEEDKILQDSASNTSKSVEKYSLKMNKDGKDYEEKIEIDTERETETFHVPKTSPNEEAGDIVYDFKQNLTMIRIPAANSCYLMQSTDDVPKPADLKRLLENKGGVANFPKSQTEVGVKIAGTIEDRSHLTDKMADLCAKLPIYFVTEGKVDTTNAVQPTNNAPPKRIKRGWIQKLVCKWRCKKLCKRICSWGFCKTFCIPPLCKPICVLTWVLVVAAAGAALG